MQADLPLSQNPPHKPAPQAQMAAWPVRALLAVAVMLGFISIYQFSGHRVPVLVNGQAFNVHTHRLSVDAVLLKTGLNLKPEDSLSHAPGHPLNPGQSLQIKLARPIIVDLPQQNSPQSLFTQAQTPAEIYTALGLTLQAEDKVFVNDQIWPANQPLPSEFPNAPGIQANLRQRVEALRPLPLRLHVHQAITVRINDGDTQLSLSTTAQSVGDVLIDQNIPLYLGDAISPDLSAPLAPDMTIDIERAIPASILVDGRTIKTRTRRETVGQLLAQEGVILTGQDYTIPAEQAVLEADSTIDVVRVLDVVELSEKRSEYETIWLPDPNLEIDRQQVEQEGQAGITKTRARVVYENGQEISRVEEETWLDQSPSDKVIRYGTQITVRTLDTPDGPIEYWRKIRMLATSYSAATSGKSRDHPTYGITRSGLPAGYGVVAVDPRVVRLSSQVYVPNYGQAIAGDTGGAILGKHIDLGYDEDQPPLWYRWVDVYLLTPIPPASQIRYVLPQWPQER